MRRADSVKDAQTIVAHMLQHRTAREARLRELQKWICPNRGIFYDQQDDFEDRAKLVRFIHAASSATLRGLVIQDYDVLSQIPAGMLDKIDLSVSAVVRARAAENGAKGNKGSIAKALEKIAKKLRDAKVSQEEKARLAEYQSELSRFVGKVEQYDANPGPYFDKNLQQELTIPKGSWAMEPEPAAHPARRPMTASCA